jgi:lysophospholipase L1-like esterase
MKKDILNMDPSYMSILIGINDVWHEIGEGNGVDAVKFDRVYDWLITELKEAKPDLQIMILEPFVLKGPATEHAWEEFYSETLLRSAACKRLAEKHSLIFVPLQEKLEALAAQTSNTYVLGDGVHPTYAGHQVIARALGEVYKNLL